MNTCNYSLNPSALINFPIDKYEENFTFIVNGQLYKTSRIVADLLSPTIRNNHYNDSSNNKFTINISNDTFNKSDSSDYFSDFLKLARFESNEIDSKRRERYSEYFLQLGNFEEFLRLQEEDNDESELNDNQIIKKSIQSIQRLRTKVQNNDFLYSNDTIQRHLKILSEHFSIIDQEDLKILGKENLDEIIRSKNLKIQDEDELFDKLFKLYEEDRAYGSLFEYILFSNISEENIF